MGVAGHISQLLLHNKWLKNSDTSNQRHFFSGTQVYWSLADRLTGWAQKLVLPWLPGHLPGSRTAPPSTWQWSHEHRGQVQPHEYLSALLACLPFLG